MKPSVHYRTLMLPVVVGRPAFLNPTDHYSSLVSNTKTVRTSPVVAYNQETGVIETENTLYERAKVK